MEGMPRPVSVPKGRITVSPWVQAGSMVDPQTGACKYVVRPLLGRDAQMGDFAHFQDRRESLDDETLGFLDYAKGSKK